MTDAPITDAARRFVFQWHNRWKFFAKSHDKLALEVDAFAAAAVAEERALTLAYLRRWAIGSGWVHGKSPGAAWENGLNEAADAIERGDHKEKTNAARK